MFGSDFTYEDVSRQKPSRGLPLRVFIKEGKEAGGKDYYVVKSAPKAADMEYRYKMSWIDETTFLPLKRNTTTKGELYKVFTAKGIKDVKASQQYQRGA